MRSATFGRSSAQGSSLAVTFYSLTVHVPKETSEPKGQDEKVQQVFSIKETEQGRLPQGRGTASMLPRASSRPRAQRRVNLQPLACLRL